MRRAAKGAGEAGALVAGQGGTLNSPDWSHDDRYLVHEEASPETQRDIRYIELGTDGNVGEPVTLVGSPATERFPEALAGWSLSGLHLRRIRTQ